MCYTTVIVDLWLKRKKVTIKPSENRGKKLG